MMSNRIEDETDMVGDSARTLNRRLLLKTVGASTAFGIAGCQELGVEDDTSTEDGDDEDREDNSDHEDESDEEAGPETTPEISDSTIEETEILEGEAITVTAIVLNPGDESTEFEITLFVGDDAIANETVTLSKHEEKEIEFVEQIATSGTREVMLNDESVGELVVRAEKLETVPDVCAHYYPWYGAPAHSWRGGEWSLESPSTPVLGNYHSTEAAVIEQHIDWCRAAGISWLNVSWWGKGSHEDERLKNTILDHPRADELKWSILYETPGQFGEGTIDMDAEPNRRRFREDLEYLDGTYFDRDSYKRIDERPVLYIWIAHALQGDVVTAYENAVDAAGVRPYLIVDLPETSPLNAHPVTAVADAVTTYNPYTPREDIEDVFLERMESAYRTWYLAAQYIDIDFIPTALPGFDDTAITHVPRDNPPLEPAPDQYEQAARITRRFAEGPVFVTSFNEWYEDTQIEPSKEYGDAYLDITADVLATEAREPPETAGETLAFTFEQSVPESELNPAVEEGRDLTMSINRLTVRDEQGEVVLDVDVGGEEEEGVSFLLGAYEKERTNTDTWRWLGGTTTTVLHAPSVPESGRIELIGRGATEMIVSLRLDDEVRGETTIGTAHGTYTIGYG